MDAAGPHPREILYRYIVEQMLPEVVRLLGLPEPSVSATARDTS